MSTEEDKKFIVIDNGSGQVKAGISGDDAPKCVFPSVIGYPKEENVMVGADNKVKYVGEEALSKRGVLKLVYPVDHGVIKDWEDMKLLWNHTFYDQLRIDNTADQRVMLTEAPSNPKENREKMLRFMFDEYSVEGVYIAIQAVLSLYASGRTTGLVLDSGDGVTHTVPIYEGFSLPKSIMRVDIAGRDVTKRMSKKLQENGIKLVTSAELEIVRDIKEKISYVADDYHAELERAKTIDGYEEIVRNYTMPDGNIINVCTERFDAPEVVFKPILDGVEADGMHEQVINSIKASDIDTRSSLYRNIVMSGGTTLIDNINVRVENELRSVIPTSQKIKVIAPPERKYSVWIGGSILASLSTFWPMCVSMYDYQEEGASIAHRKFF